MYRTMLRGFAVVAYFASAALAAAGDHEGRYVSEQEGMELVIKGGTGDSITGVLSGGDGKVEFTAKEKNGRYVGTVSIEGEKFPIAVQWNGDLVNVEIGPQGEGEELAFVRAKPAAAGPEKREVAQKDGKPPARKVIINGRRFTDEELDFGEKNYGIRIPDADYWYDKVLGAWGVRGSPTLGFLAPGLELGGDLQADASGGGTGIFVNGRELHPYDVLALQQITGPIIAGRYFITAQGYAGIEGSPPMWDLGAMMRQAGGGGGGGGSNTWQSRITGASGFSDGTTSAVFLPNGGIVSTGN